MVLGLYDWWQKINPEKYKYFDTPDGQDCPRKMFYLAKCAAVAGTVASGWDILLFSHPQNYTEAALRVGFWMYPLVATATAYGAATCVATDLRKKDDEINHMVGGAVAGGVWGAIRGSIPQGARAALIWGGMGAIIKADKINNYGFFRMKEQRILGSVRQVKYDFTLHKEPEHPFRGRDS